MSLIKKKTGRKVSVHGHRGSRGTHPENTIPSLQEAVDAGVDYFEIDVHLTKDNVPIVFHDDSISDRLCTGADGRPVSLPVDVRTLTVAELKRYDVGSIAQERFPKQVLKKGTRIPTLDEVLAWAAKSAPGVGINIEIKVEGDTGAPDPLRYAEIVLAAIKKAEMLDKVLFQSFDFKPLDALRKLDSSVVLSYLFDRDEAFLDAAIKHKAKIVAPFYHLLNRDNIKACHDKGIEVLPWTVNEKTDWDRLIGWGVDGIITDFPRALVGIV